jgi:hypothetical protein
MGAVGLPGSYPATHSEWSIRLTRGAPPVEKKVRSWSNRVTDTFALGR